ncbi:Succinate--CoA ligase subunit beta [Penicillium macrosclerotiorum]|uniref:Succinate--CoA ligase subunit beta n=1 Tax=Penicillium macrosclerotiorum TaxID=303699 RepID=UPI002546ECFF|nr:Succinate--CoA ligase subunit beta [Penicillium macrosclerotiorum]KAJ5669256.1 Succinate--CoA ligase subunit beta [Penicillium macrosclerotiorum]
MTIRNISTRLLRPSCGLFKKQVRQLSLLEHHSHKLLKDFNIPVPNGFVVTTPEEAREVVSTIDAPSVVKAQVLAGGRGKGSYESDGKGGVRIMTSPIEAFENASNMLGYYLTTKQTPIGGLLVKKLYIYKAVDVAQEYYVALTFDRERSMPVLLISDVGGVDIESNTDKLQRYWFHLSHGITPEIIAYVQAQLGFSDTEMSVIGHILHQMVRLFEEKDATLIELNPIVRTSDGHFVCLDAKFNFDNSARFRQPEIFSLEERLPDEEEEYEASKLGLSYVRLDGKIGNIVNGAGLAMATNDLISLHGGNCANFLDIGGAATKTTLSKAFEILNRDPRIQGILINIYGGIVRCDMIAESIIAAAAATGGFNVPIVVRLQGTNSEKGLKLILQSGLENVHVESDFESAAKMIVNLTENIQ